MTAPALPRLDLLDPDPADAVIIDGAPMALDQAVIVIDGREEDTITIECEGARALAKALVHAVTIANLFVAQPLPPADDHQTPYRAIDC